MGSKDQSSYKDLPEMLELKNQITPGYLYKFYSCTKYAFDSLLNNRIWLSKPFYFNDPFEFQAIYVSDNFYDKEFDMEAAKVRHILRTHSIGVACFVEDFKSLPMWAYYAQEHKGFCVKYKVIDNKSIYPVIYSDSRIAHHMRDIDDFCDPNVNQQYNFYFSIKHSSWKHEKEYRIIKPLSGDLNIIKGERFACGNLGVQIEEIIAGCKCSSINVKKLNSIATELTKQRNNAKISFRQYTLSDREFLLIANP